MANDDVEMVQEPTCKLCVSCIVCRVRASFMLILKDMGKDAPINEDHLAKICTQYKLDVIVVPTDVPEPKDEPVDTIELGTEYY